MGNCWSYLCCKTHISDGEYTPDETTLLLSREAYRRRLVSHVKDMGNVTNVNEVVEQLMSEVPENFFIEPEQPSNVVFVP